MTRPKKFFRIPQSSRSNASQVSIGKRKCSLSTRAKHTPIHDFVVKSCFQTRLITSPIVDSETGIPEKPTAPLARVLKNWISIVHTWILYSSKAVSMSGRLTVSLFRFTSVVRAIALSVFFLIIFSDFSEIGEKKLSRGKHRNVHLEVLDQKSI